VRNLRWDIFCSVIDNYGDVGVAWRLARQLVAEHGMGVRLVVDDPGALSRLSPDVAPGMGSTHDELAASGVWIRRWTGGQDAALPDDPADVVIEAFGCGLPARYQESMARRARRPAWIVLEYLSAEPWIETHHGLPSPHPSRPLARHFFFPGFTPATGGLLRERGLFACRDAFRSDARARTEFWRALGIEPSVDAIVVSLFCYPDAPLPALLDSWAEGEHDLICTVPEGVATGAIDRWTAGKVTRPGQSIVRGSLTLAAIPFLPQEDYDRLLWASDFNFVRGEDSFVRAQWAARPWVWNAYPQAGKTRAEKLDAFLARYANGLAPGVAAILYSFHETWNGAAERQRDIVTLWGALVDARSELDEYASTWAQALAAQPDLTSSLVEFASGLV
jgi:uncharacterized repeat protein (TIGR03837 family)